MRLPLLTAAAMLALVSAASANAIPPALNASTPLVRIKSGWPLTTGATYRRWLNAPTNVRFQG